MSTNEQLRDLLRSVVDPEHPDYVPPQTMACFGQAWGAAYIRACTILGTVASGDAAVALQATLCDAAPGRVRPVVLEAFCDAFGVACTGDLAAACLDDDNHHWTDALAAALAGGA